MYAQFASYMFQYLESAKTCRKQIVRWLCLIFSAWLVGEVEFDIMHSEYNIK